MNSIRFLQKAAEYEIERQSEILNGGGTVLQETRSFDPEKGKTFGMRVKETMNDYRYFPEPDLAPVIISDDELEKEKQNMPELPLQLFEKYAKSFGLLEEHAYLLTEEKELSEYFEEIIKTTSNKKSAANWVLSNIKGALNESGKSISEFEISPEKIGQLINTIDDGKISNSAAQTLMNLLITSPESDIMQLAESNNLIQTDDQDALGQWIDEVLAQNIDKVNEYKKGKKGLLGMFVGEVMKKSKGSADPKKLNQLLLEKLK